MTPTPPPSRFLPAREEWLDHWVGPVQVHRAHPQEPMGFWDDGAYIGGWADSGMVRTCDVAKMRLDPTRPEVRHLIADRLGLGMEYRSGAYSVPLAWWAGMTGRPITHLLSAYQPAGGVDSVRYSRHANVIVGGGEWVIYRQNHNPVCGPETGDAGKLAADTAALAHDCAIVVDSGSILLPPLTPGTAPILWSTP